MINDLIVIDDSKLPELFTKNGCDPIIERIRAEVEGFEPVISTAKGRKDIASIAYKIRQSKTVIDNAGKEFVAKIKIQTKAIDAERKRVRDELDRMATDIRSPLDEWEKKEKARIEAEELAKEVIESHELALAENDLFDRKRELDRIESEQEKKKIAEREEQDRREYEEAVLRKAQEKAEKDAQDKIEAERERAKQAERDKIISEERAEREKEKAVIEERKRIEREEKEKLEIEKKASEDINHRRDINNEVLQSLIDFGMIVDLSKSLIEAVYIGKIKNMFIKY